MRARNAVLRVVVALGAAAVAVSGSSGGAVGQPAPGVGTVTASSAQQPARLPDDLRAALAKGPADALVTFDGSAARGRLLGASSLDAASATRAVARASAENAGVKRAVLSAIGVGVHVKRDYSALAVQLITLADLDSAKRLAARTGVVALALPTAYRPQAPAVLTPAAAQAALTSQATYTDPKTQIRQPQAAALGFTGAGFRVAVLDTGLDWNPPRVLPDAEAFGTCTVIGSAHCRVSRLVDATVTPQPRSYVDILTPKHGTNVAGIVAGVAPQAGLDVYKVFKAGADGVAAYDEDILTAINDVLVDGAA